MRLETPALAALSALLAYPSEAMCAALAEVEAILADGLGREASDALAPLIGELAAWDLYDLQERYVALFDRTRRLSLNMFEHVHGESRDRGQAIVDLAALYETTGLEIAAREAPDYLPLFLEFLATRPLDEARELLADAAPVLSALETRLADRGSPYAIVFAALSALAGAERRPSDGEPSEPDDLAALDAAWEEEAVRFGSGAATEDCLRRTAQDAHHGGPSRRPQCRPAPAQFLKDEAMSQAINSALFGWYPYLCLTVFRLGSLIRFDREQYTWRSGSSQLLRRRQLMWSSNLFHIGVLVIFVGHFVGLLTPIAVFDALGISHEFKQAMAIIVGGVAGIAAFVGAAMLAHRRLYDARVRANSSFGDTAILLILWAQLTLGLLTITVSLQHLDGHEMTKFMAWAQGILTLQPGSAAYVADANPLFKIHMLLGMTIFLVCPFTRLVHVWSAPIWYLGRTGYQIVRTRRALVATSGRPT